MTFGGDRSAFKDRPNTEIDLRAGRARNGVNGGVDIALTARTTIVTSFTREIERYDDEEVYQGTLLSETLDRDTDTARAGLRFSLTPLTSVTLATEIQKDRFPRSRIRDADSIRLAPEFEFSPDALVSGRAAVGFRRFRTLDSDVPDFTGLVARVEVGFTLLGRAQIDVVFDRDVRYSFQDSHPFYLATAASVALTQRVAGPIDVLAEVGRENLDYQAPSSSLIEPERDAINTVGGGVAVRFGETARFELTMEHARRAGTDVNSGFRRNRIFGAIDLEF